jgi:hypothetical protein
MMPGPQVLTGLSGGQRIRTSTGLPPAVFKLSLASWVPLHRAPFCFARTARCSGRLRLAVPS